MGMVEVAYEVRESAPVLVFSTYFMDYDDSHLTEILSALASNPDMNGVELSEIIVDSYDGDTLSSINLTNIGNLKDSISTLATTIKDDWAIHPNAVKDVAKDVMDEVDIIVLFENHHSSFSDETSGLWISVFPLFRPFTERR